MRRLNFGAISVRSEITSKKTSGWNLKPHVLLQLMDEGYEEVIWIDSDILVTRDVYSDLSGLSRIIFVAAEEGLLGQNETEPLRAQLWGFPVARKFKFPLNTGVLRVTKAHIPLLRRWKELLESELYRQAQAQPMTLRPKHMFSDQDVLTALLSSEQFHKVPLKVLRRGRHIIQFYEYMGFTVRERIRCLFMGMPTFVHQQGWKPWLSGSERLSGLRGKLLSAYQDLSPYTMVALTLAPGIDWEWLRARSRLSSVLRAISSGRPQLAGLPLAIFFDLERLLLLPRRLAGAVLKYLAKNSLLNGLRWIKKRPR